MDFLAKLLLLLSLGAATLSLAVKGEVEGQQPVDSPPNLQAQAGKPLTPKEPPSANPRVHPIILVPGDGGSQIEAKLNKTKVGSSKSKTQRTVNSLRKILTQGTQVSFDCKMWTKDHLFPFIIT